MKKISIEEIKEKLKGKEKEYYFFLESIKYLGYIIELLDEDTNKIDIEYLENIEELKYEIEYYVKTNFKKIVSIYEIVK